LWIKEKDRAKRQNRHYEKFANFNLCDYAWVFDAISKTEVMMFVQRSQQAQSMDQSILGAFSAILRNQQFELPYFVLKVNRATLLEDSITLINNSQLNLKKPLKVQFEGEPGIDEGGVRKEFFQLLVKQLFDPNYAMFHHNDSNGLYWFNGWSPVAPITFELCGVLMGLAVFNQVLIDMPFPLACFKKLVNEKITFDDLREWQPDIAQSLEFILRYEDEKPLEEVLGTTFTLDVEQWGEVQQVELKEGGGEIMVTKDNKEEYVELYLDYIFNRSCRDQFKFF
jgi:E3 ubiquitin-protein ligase HERC4